MKIFQNLFSSQHAPHSDASEQQRLSAKGPETAPVKMNLEERMAFRRGLLFEVVRSSLDHMRIAPGSYRFRVMRTDKRGHCYAIMMDMSPAFMNSQYGQHRQLVSIAALLTKDARLRYGLFVSGVYWRIDDTLDPVATAQSRTASAQSTSGTAADDTALVASHAENVEHVTAETLANFEAAWQKSRDIQIGNRTYSTHLAPLGEDPPQR